MNIGIDARYIQDHFPGIGRYTFNLIRALVEVAPNEHFVVFYNPALRNTRYDLSELAHYPNIELRRIDLRTFSIAEQVAWPRIARDLSLDLLHSPYYIKPYWLPCPSVVTIYDVISARYPEYLPSAWARLAFEVTTRLALASARQVITLSHASQRDLEELYGVPATKICVTSLAADECFRPASAEAIDAVRARYCLPERYVLYVGINKPHKNLVRLVEAWARIKDWGLGTWKLVIAGREDLRHGAARKRVEELGVGHVIQFLGEIAEADLPALYSGAELFVFPSLYEGFGLPVVEAMACGTPVVCSNVSSLPEVVGEAGLLVNPMDVDALADAILKVLRDRNLHETLRLKGVAQAARFSWQETARLTLQAYRKVVTGD